ncbi:MAG: hypothetical protein ABW185_06945 [Sedimenticola sp.]
MELKRRMQTRAGDPLVKKLARDIHCLISVVEGADFNVLVDMLSLSRPAKPRNSQSSKSHTPISQYSNTCGCEVELKLLKDTLAQVKADIINLKQTNVVNEMRKEQINTLKCSVTNLKSDIMNMRQTFCSTLYELNRQLSLLSGGNTEALCHMSVPSPPAAPYTSGNTDKRSDVSPISNIGGTHTNTVQKEAFTPHTASPSPIGNSRTPERATAEKPPSGDENIAGADPTVVLSPNSSLNNVPMRQRSMRSNQTANGQSNSAQGDDTATPKTVASSGTITADKNAVVTTYADALKRVTGPDCVKSSTSRCSNINSISGNDTDSLTHTTRGSNAPTDCGLSLQSQGESDKTASNTTVIFSASNEVSTTNIHRRSQSDDPRIGQLTASNAPRHSLNIPVMVTRRSNDLRSDGRGSNKRRNNIRNFRSVSNVVSVRESDSSTQDEISSTNNKLGHGDLVLQDLNENTDSADKERNNDDLSDYVRKRPKRYYIGGFKAGISEDRIYRYVEKRGPRVSQIKIFKSRTPNSVTIRLNVESDSNCHLVEQPRFWPRNVVCRPWISNGPRRKEYQNNGSGLSNNRDDYTGYDGSQNFYNYTGYTGWKPVDDYAGYAGSHNPYIHISSVGID